MGKAASSERRWLRWRATGAWLARDRVGWHVTTSTESRWTFSNRAEAVRIAKEDAKARGCEDWHDLFVVVRPVRPRRVAALPCDECGGKGWTSYVPVLEEREGHMSPCEKCDLGHVFAAGVIEGYERARHAAKVASAATPARLDADGTAPGPQTGERFTDEAES